MRRARERDRVSRRSSAGRTALRPSSRSAPSSVSPRRSLPRCSSRPCTSSSTGCGTTSPNVCDASGPPLVSRARAARQHGACVVLLARTLTSRATGGHGPLGRDLAWSRRRLRMRRASRSQRLGTLAFGAVLGPEAPLIALGSVVGRPRPASLARADPRDGRVLSTAGSFSAHLVHLRRAARRRRCRRSRPASASAPPSSRFSSPASSPPSARLPDLRRARGLGRDRCGRIVGPGLPP